MKKFITHSDITAYKHISGAYIAEYEGKTAKGNCKACAKRALLSLLSLRLSNIKQMKCICLKEKKGEK